MKEEECVNLLNKIHALQIENKRLIEIICSFQIERKNHHDNEKEDPKEYIYEIKPHPFVNYFEKKNCERNEFQDIHTQNDESSTTKFISKFWNNHEDLEMNYLNIKIKFCKVVNDFSHKMKGFFEISQTIYNCSDKFIHFEDLKFKTSKGNLKYIFIVKKKLTNFKILF